MKNKIYLFFICSTIAYTPGVQSIQKENQKIIIQNLPSVPGISISNDHIIVQINPLAPVPLKKKPDSPEYQIYVIDEKFKILTTAEIPLQEIKSQQFNYFYFGDDKNLSISGLYQSPANQLWNIQNLIINNKGEIIINHTIASPRIMLPDLSNALEPYSIHLNKIDQFLWKHHGKDHENITLPKEQYSSFSKLQGDFFPFYIKPEQYKFFILHERLPEKDAFRQNKFVIYNFTPRHKETNNPSIEQSFDFTKEVQTRIKKNNPQRLQVYHQKFDIIHSNITRYQDQEYLYLDFFVHTTVKTKKHRRTDEHEFYIGICNLQSKKCRFDYRQPTQSISAGLIGNILIGYRSDNDKLILKKGIIKLP